MFVFNAIAKILGWVRAGYPLGVPATDTFPVLAVLPHQLSYAELSLIHRLGFPRDIEATA